MVEQFAWYQYILIVLAGFIAGVVNMYAGSGSLVSLSLLFFLGVPPQLANGTNRVAITLQNVVGSRGFAQHGLLDLRHALRVAIPAALGSIVGSYIANIMSADQFDTAVAVVFVIMLGVILVRPKRWIEGRPGEANRHLGWVEVVLFFFIGIYGGFIQAGVGVFLLAGLVLRAGFDIMTANGIKVFIVLCLTIPALVVFLINGQVDWGIGLTLALGNMSGAWLATRFAGRPGVGVWAHRLLVVIVIVSILRLFGLF